MSILETVSPFMSPHDRGVQISGPGGSQIHLKVECNGQHSERSSEEYKNADIKYSYKKFEKQQSYTDLTIDPFISRYIRSPHLNTPFNYHNVFFESVKDDLNSQLFDLYQKYLIQKDNNHITKPTKTEPEVKINVSHELGDTRKKIDSEADIVTPQRTSWDHDTNLQLEIKYLPKNFMDCDISNLIDLISRLLRSLIALNDKNVHPSIANPQKGSKATNQILTRYHSRTPPAISAHTYLSRLTRFNNLNPGTLLTTIYYIDLLSHHYQPYFTLNSWTVHRFLLVATMLSQKLLEDFFYTNEHYAKVGGVAVSELNCLELDFLERVDWRCVPGKVDENNSFSIKYAKTTLDLYYAQLVSLMGQPSNGTSGATYRIKNSDEEGVLEDESNDDIFDDEEGDEDAMEDEVFETAGQGTRAMYDHLGYSVDGSSSPHLKRLYSKNFAS
jgi:hypothetical protein